MILNVIHKGAAVMRFLATINAATSYIFFYTVRQKKTEPIFFCVHFFKYWTETVDFFSIILRKV